MKSMSKCLLKAIGRLQNIIDAVDYDDPNLYASVSLSRFETENDCSDTAVGLIIAQNKATKNIDIKNIFDIKTK